jgi:general secretion pathway protein G
MKARKGFTLVEILIVVVILGILAAIVIPQFSQASTEARESNLISNLQSVRAQIELYRIQHLDCVPETSALAAPTNQSTFTEALTGYTDINGNALTKVEADAFAGAVYGPYMKKVPLNPFNQITVSATDKNGKVATQSTGTVPTGAGSGTNSWLYDSSLGEIWADDVKKNADGDFHSTL